MTLSNRFRQLFIIAAAVVLNYAPAFAQPQAQNAYSLPMNTCYYDSPACSCFIDGGSWDPYGSDILTVAHQTVGTEESCLSEDGGKPFYQMQMGLNGAGSAQLAAAAFHDVLPNREQWCTEAVSYWHREAQIPGPEGYKSAWQESWKLRGTEGIRNWYKTAEIENAGGRWIDSTELDVANFQPGVNAPCPGAYQQIIQYDEYTEEWNEAKSHSQVVDTMTVYRYPTGQVVDFDMRMIEGNWSDEVYNSTVYTSAPEYTPQGSLFIDPTGKHRKIRGWGIDVDAKGQARCDLTQITYVLVPLDTEYAYNHFLPEIIEAQRDWAIVRRNLAFVKAVRAWGGPRIQIDDEESLNRNLPSRKAPLIFAKEVISDEPIRLSIEYPLPLPYRVGSVELKLAGSNVPKSITALVNGEEILGRIVRDKTNLVFFFFEEGFDIQSIELEFANVETLRILSIDFHPFKTPPSR